MYRNFPYSRKTNVFPTYTIYVEVFHLFLCLGFDKITRWKILETPSKWDAYFFNAHKYFYLIKLTIHPSFFKVFKNMQQINSTSAFAWEILSHVNKLSPFCPETGMVRVKCELCVSSRVQLLGTNNNNSAQFFVVCISGFNYHFYCLSRFGLGAQFVVSKAQTQNNINLNINSYRGQMNNKFWWSFECTIHFIASLSTSL